MYAPQVALQHALDTLPAGTIRPTSHYSSSQLELTSFSRHLLWPCYALGRTLQSCRSIQKFVSVVVLQTLQTHARQRHNLSERRFPTLILQGYMSYQYLNITRRVYPWMLSTKYHAHVATWNTIDGVCKTRLCVASQLVKCRLPTRFTTRMRDTTCQLPALPNTRVHAHVLFPKQKLHRSQLACALQCQIIEKWTEW